MEDNVDAIYHGIDPETGKKFENLTDEEFLDCFPEVKCSYCCYHGNCSMFRNGKIEFYRPWFACCSDGPVCKNFYPSIVYSWLKKYWRGVDIFVKDKKDTDTVAFFLDGDTNVIYYCLYKDFFNNDLWDDNGNLKWIKRSYYKRNKSSPIGYVLVTEEMVNS